MQIFGILNITRDSFSDGGRYLDPAAALAHARQLVADGAAVIDVGAESTHPEAEFVPAEEEIARLAPVVRALVADGVAVSVDTWKADVMRAMIELGVGWINDVTGLADAAAVEAVRGADVRIVVMHSTGAGPRARREDVPVEGIVEWACAYFEERIASLAAAGVARERLVLDPGMGLFLSRDPAVSVAVLRALPRLAAMGLPLMISAARKSFVGDLIEAAGGGPRRAKERGAGTLAAELWAASKGVAYIRTHDVRAMADAWRVWSALAGA